MLNQQGKLIVIHQFPTPNMRPFLNPVCKGTYDALPKIYGRKGKKRYFLNIQQILNAHPASCCPRECCKHEEKQRFRAKTEVKQPKKIKIDASFTQPKGENCHKNNCICHTNQSVTAFGKNELVKHTSPKTKLKKILLPNLKQFHSQQICEAETKHKVAKAVTAMSLNQSRQFDSQKVSRTKFHRKQEQQSGRDSPKSSYIQAFNRSHTDNVKEKEQVKVSRFRLQSIDDKRYYEYLQNDPRIKQGQQGQRNLKKSNNSQDDTFSLSSFSIKNKKQPSTIFHQYKKKQQKKKEASDSNTDKKKSRAYSILSNGLFKIPEEEELQDYLLNYKAMNPQFDLKELAKQPNFQIIPTEGKVYFGQISQQKKHGKGVTVSQKQIYQGKYHNNAKIYGCQKNIDGVYTGQFQRGKRHGKGKFIWANGEQFDGDWIEGKKNGFGIWKSPKGDYYEGEWKQNRQSGKGYYFHVGGSKYRGQFKQFLKHGKGQQEFSNGDSYSGQYSCGKPHGYGKYVWSNGDIYQGQFFQGSRQGKGLMKRKSGQIYQGDFKNDSKHGFGKQKYKTGQYFEGQFVEGEKSEGKLFTRNGVQIKIKGD